MVGEGSLSKHGNTLGVGLDEVDEARGESKGIAEQNWFGRFVPNESLSGQVNPSTNNENCNSKGGN